MFRGPRKLGAAPEVLALPWCSHGRPRPPRPPQEQRQEGADHEWNAKRGSGPRQLPRPQMMDEPGADVRGSNREGPKPQEQHVAGADRERNVRHRTGLRHLPQMATKSGADGRGSAGNGTTHYTQRQAGADASEEPSAVLTASAAPAPAASEAVPTPEAPAPPPQLLVADPGTASAEASAGPRPANSRRGGHRPVGTQRSAPSVQQPQVDSHSEAATPPPSSDGTAPAASTADLANLVAQLTAW
ncbi:translation initiation factor IF-2-like [Schistocerca nitens]|uniref:translation initiation factor IF-2-like n=1 Tax=Schistocerca nitens TaxID=7011 RepID=UPI002117D074|nr:translation initiation factor IF-2-like [Schistocerca nitens]